jgi:hypothetical protein
MRTSLLLVSVVIVAAGQAQAQTGATRRGAAAGATQCITNQAMSDSARSEVVSVITSSSTLVQELRRDVGATADRDFTPVSIVNERTACARAIAAFPHVIGSTERVILLRLGPIYYLRDPDQRRSTGVILGQDMKVLLTLDRKIPN